VRGLLTGGLNVVDIGICPSPLVYFSLFQLPVDGGIMITGSHNAAEYNGFKICIGKDAIHGEEIQALRAVMEAGSFVSGTGQLSEHPIILTIGYIKSHPCQCRYHAADRGKWCRPGGGQALAAAVTPGPQTDEVSNHIRSTVRESHRLIRSSNSTKPMSDGTDGDADRRAIDERELHGRRLRREPTRYRRAGNHLKSSRRKSL
jgi:phosphomannomutase